MPAQRNNPLSLYLQQHKSMLMLLTIGLCLQILVYCLHPTDWITILSGLAGVCSVVLCAQGKITTFAFGFIQITTYLYLAWQERLWAEVAMNIFYLLSQFYGIFFWKKRYTSELAPRRLTHKSLALLALICLLGSVLCAWLLQTFTNDSQPWLDAFTTIPSIAAQILLVLAYREQWFLWLFVDILAAGMWIIAGNYALAVLYLFWCINCLYGLHHWNEAQQQTM